MPRGLYVAWRLPLVFCGLLVLLVGMLLIGWRDYTALLQSQELRLRSEQAIAVLAELDRLAAPPTEMALCVAVGAPVASAPEGRPDGNPWNEPLARLRGLVADNPSQVGRVESLTNETLRILVAGEPVDTPLESVAALRLSGEQPEPNKPTCLGGLTDGSLLRADTLVVADEAYTANVSGAEVTGEAATLAFVQPLSKGVSYLSDLEPADYRHTPYLDLPWPYARDTGLRGGPLVGGGRRAAKGVAMHTAARLVYRLDGSPQRFQADIAVADPEPGAAPTGSVSFRVYLVKEGKFEPAYEGDAMRVGQPAQPIDIDLTGAAALALVVDFADDGDAGDDALWLDARLVPAE